MLASKLGLQVRIAVIHLLCAWTKQDFMKWSSFDAWQQRLGIAVWGHASGEQLDPSDQRCCSKSTAVLCGRSASAEMQIICWAWGEVFVC